MNHSINLYNPALRRRKSLLSATNMVQGLLIVLAGILALYAYTTHVEESLRVQQANLEQVFNNDQAQFNHLATLLSSKATNQSTSAEIQALEQQLQNRHQLFAAISGALSGNHGYSQYLRAFARQNVEGLWLTAFSIDARGEHMQIHGRTLHAELIPIYLQRLSQEPILQGKHFAALELRTSAAETSNADQHEIIDFTLHSTEGDKPK